MEALSNDINLDLGRYDIPRFIAVEGPIGVGKTTLAKRLAATFNYDTLLEQPEENPFLERFYRDRRGAALPTQLFFLFQRMRMLQELRQGDIFQPVRIADFLMEKDPLFASVCLDEDELRLYTKVYEQMSMDVLTPDLVALGPHGSAAGASSIPMEQQIDQDYLRELNDAYTQFFHFYEGAPLLIVNAAEIDLAASDRDYGNLVQYLLNIKTGRHYYNPAPF